MIYTYTRYEILPACWNVFCESISFCTNTYLPPLCLVFDGTKPNPVRWCCAGTHEQNPVRSANFAIHRLGFPPPSGATPAVPSVGDASVRTEAIRCAVWESRTRAGIGGSGEKQRYCAVSVIVSFAA